MTTEQLQHLGRLLVSGEDNALLARELMIGQGIWNAQGVCDCLNAVAPVNIFQVPNGLLVTDFGASPIRYPYQKGEAWRVSTPCEKEQARQLAYISSQYVHVNLC